MQMILRLRLRVVELQGSITKEMLDSDPAVLCWQWHAGRGTQATSHQHVSSLVT